MRAAIIKSNYTPYGGGEKYTLKVIEGFRNKGIEVTLVTARRGGFEEVMRDEKRGQEKFSLVALPQIPYNNLLRLLSFNRSVNKFLEREHFDIVLGMDRNERQTHIRAGGGCHAAWLRRRGAFESLPKRLSLKVNPFHRGMVNLERKAFTSPELRKIIVNSLMVKKEILDLYGIPESKISIVHNGVEWDEFENSYQIFSKDQILRELGIPEGRFYYLFVGSGYGRKGLAQAINAMPHLPDYTSLLVLGKDRNEGKYRRLASKLNIANRVLFFGPQKRGMLIRFLQVADAFVLPTIYDPFSNATLEALAMGLFVITSDANGCSEIVQKGAGMVIRDLLDTESVADAMATALGNHLGKKEIRESVRHLTFESQLGRLIEECLSN